MRIHRLIAILLLIESRGHIKAKELADALETSVRTIYRDIDTLCESGIPILSVTGPNGGISLMENYTVNMNKLHGDELINLYLSGIGMKPEAHSDTGIKLKNALMKIEKGLPDEYREDIRKARERFYFDETPWWGERPSVPYMEVIRRAVMKNRKLTIKYKKTNGEVSIRDVLPYGLVVKSMDWYLVAYCERSSDIRSFKCERIITADMQESCFVMPSDFSIEDYWKRGSEIFKEKRAEVEKYPVLLKLSKRNAEALKKLELYNIRYENEHILATVNMHTYEFACCEVIDIIGHAEVIEPIELRAYVKQELIRLNHWYC